MKTVEGTQTFQGAGLRGSLQGKSKQGTSISESLQTEMETAVNLTTQGLHKRFGILLNTENQAGNDYYYYGPKDVVSDMLLFNVTC